MQLIQRFLTIFLLHLLVIECSVKTLSVIAKEFQQFQTQDGYIIENGLQGSEREIRIEDFFWTGSGDGPPNYIRPASDVAGNAADSGGRASGGTIIKTATVLATVYVDGSMENLDPLCTIDCDTYEFNSIETTIPSDRRYWLLTVVGGFFGPQDFPILEEKLAKLYRIAFTRQQARHLGINGHNSTNTSSTERIKRHAIHPTKVLPEKNNQALATNHIYINRIVYSYERNFIAKRKQQQLYHKIRRRKRDLFDTHNINSSLVIPIKLGNNSADKSDYQKILIDRRNSNKRKVTVLIHNVTQLTEEDITRSIDMDMKIGNDTNVARNQTEIIYSVFVSGIPVLATTAAKDMELLTTEEVMKEIKHPIMTKAEPYLKEPQATPLIPSGYNGSSNLVTIIAENPWWIVILVLICLLLISLLIGLLLMTKAKRRRSAELKKLVSSQHGTISPIHHHHHHHHLDTDTLKTETDTHAHENLAFSKDKTDTDVLTLKPDSIPPVIHFPLPPPVVSRPSSSSSSTSDSSIYYPKRRNKSTLQEILDEKAANLFHKKCRKHDSDSDPNKPMNNKKDKAKHKRKYLTENKVGSLEHVQVQCHSPPSTSSSDFAVEEIIKENNEKLVDKTAIVSNYHKNKLLHDTRFTREISDEDFALDKYRRDHDDETGSIGSYLSMISIRSFPKSCVPEPLNRILEPSVSVTYLDQSDHGDIDGLRSSKHLEPIISEKDEDEIGADDSHFSIELKDDLDSPIIYKLQKKDTLQQENFMSPIHDPIRVRNRFEGLLEGAIQLYTTHEGDDGASTPEIMASSAAAAYAERMRNNRGKSAIPFRNPAILSKVGSGSVRPFTAGTSSTSQSKDSQPPTPSKAWASGSHSPQVLVRPLSAGPFHKPQTPIVDVSRVLAPRTILDRSDLSTGPLIEAIQNELKKFNKDTNKS